MAPSVGLGRERPCTIGKPGVCDISVDGLLFGGFATVAWEGQAWTATFKGLVAGLEVNGERTKAAALKTGDTIRIGKSEFRLVVGQ